MYAVFSRAYTTLKLSIGVNTNVPILGSGNPRWSTNNLKAMLLVVKNQGKFYGYAVSKNSHK